VVESSESIMKQCKIVVEEKLNREMNIALIKYAMKTITIIGKIGD
jgi:hypothetical protein